VSDEPLKSSAVGSWGLLRSGTKSGSGLEIPTIPTGVFTAGGEVRFAVGKDGEPRLLLPLVDRDLPVTIQGSRTLSISVSSFTHRGRFLRYLDLICHSSELEAVFGDVVDEMLTRLDGGTGCVDAARSTIDDFRSLLLRARSKKISENKVAGLIAELIVLNRLLGRSASAWKAWRGPLGDRHDFRVGNTSLEVKATLRPDASSITISGLDQLEAPIGGTLHLQRFVLENVRDGILSVSSLGQNALSRVSEPQELHELLDASGCSDVTSDEWNRYSFRTESESLYEIRHGFPRITSSMLSQITSAHAVHAVTYKINLSDAAPYLCRPEVHSTLEAKFCK